MIFAEKNSVVVLAMKGRIGYTIVIGKRCKTVFWELRF